VGLTFLGISGSLRDASYNTVLLRTCCELAPEDVEVVIHTLHDVPLYDRDVEADGYPASVQALRDAIADADALLLASPEYNWSLSGVMKNAIDWASRGKDSPLRHKPTALLSAAGGSGGKRAQAHLRDVLGHNEVDVIDQAVGIARAWDHIDDGELTTAGHREAIAGLLVALRAHVLDRQGSART